MYICRIIEGKAKGKREFGDHVDSDEEEETAPEKRLRLAKEYLSRLEEEGNTVHIRLSCTILCGYSMHYKVKDWSRFYLTHDYLYNVLESVCI